jgi:hypothetical protein
VAALAADESSVERAVARAESAHFQASALDLHLAAIQQTFQGRPPAAATNGSPARARGNRRQAKKSMVGSKISGVRGQYPRAEPQTGQSKSRS